MLLRNILIFIIFLVLRVVSNDELCRLIEFNVPNNLEFFQINENEDKLFYKTDYLCQNRPIFRSIKYENLYQFQAPTNRWWTLYDTTNSTYKLGSRQWCDAWNIKPLLAMPLGIFQHPLGKQKRSQRWQRVITHENNNSYTYKPISNVHIKCYYSPSTSNCQTEQLTFLFDLSQTTTDEEFHQMKLLTKTLIWLLYNQTNLALSYYRDQLYLLNSFDNQTSSSSKTLEYFYDSIDIMNKKTEIPKQISVKWYETIHNIVTQLFKRRLLLPILNQNITIEDYHNQTNDTVDDDIYTEPYPLVYSDEHAIKTILNITTYLSREKRSIKSLYNKQNHVLVILTSRSKYLYDYKENDRHLAQFISLVPLRIVVIDFNKLSNKNFAEYIHSAFIHNAKYALVSSPFTYNYIETYDQIGDVIHGNQLFDDYHRLCYPSEDNLPKSSIEINTDSTQNCLLLTLFDTQNFSNLTLKEIFDYTFYQTADQCYLAPVYRSLADRNLYIQKISNDRWVIVHVDPLLPSLITIKQKYASTTTTTLPPEFYYATDYAHGPLIDDLINETSIVDQPTSIPHCSSNPGIDILWESDNSLLFNDYSLHTPHRWISNLNQTDLITPVCNKYKITCQTIQYDILILLDIQQEYSLLIQTFLQVFLSLIEPSYHRFSLIILSSTTIDTFQYHLPLTNLNTINYRTIENYFSYIDYENISTIQLNEHIQHISDYLITNQQVLSNNSSQKILLTISSRFNFNPKQMKDLIQYYSSIRYMTLDPYLRIDDNNEKNIYRERNIYLRSLTSTPIYSNLFWSYAANRDLTFNTVFHLLESLCGYIR